MEVEMITKQTRTLVEAAKNGDWYKVYAVLASPKTGYNDVIAAVDDSEESLLHKACRIENQDCALKTVNVILNRVEQTDIDDDSFRSFIDQENTSEQTALHIAADSFHVSVVQRLLEAGADVNLPFEGSPNEAFRLILDKVHQAVTLHYDKHITRTQNGVADSCWIVNCDFDCITGHREKNDDPNKWRQTKPLSLLLKQRKYIRSEILLHPLIQLFVYFKMEKYRPLIYCSNTFNCIWYGVCISMFCHVFEGEDIMRTEKCLELDGFVGIFGLVLFSLAFCKEFAEFCVYPVKRDYIRRRENWLKWTQLATVSWVFVWCQMPPIKLNMPSMIGILVTSLLIRKTFSKIECMGFYYQLLATGLRELAVLLLVFSPLFIFFGAVLHVLMPRKPQFQLPEVTVKMLMMMIGEVNYDEIFHNEKNASEIFYTRLTKGIFALFVICFVLVLNNFIIGTLVGSFQKFKAEAKENYLASQLHLIYKLEAFLTGICTKLKLYSFLNRFLVGKSDTMTTGKYGLPRNKRIGEYPYRFRKILLNISERKDDLPENLEFMMNRYSADGQEPHWPIPRGSFRPSGLDYSGLKDMLQAPEFRRRKSTS